MLRQLQYAEILYIYIYRCVYLYVCVSEYRHACTRRRRLEFRKQQHSRRIFWQLAGPPGGAGGGRHWLWEVHPGAPVPHGGATQQWPVPHPVSLLVWLGVRDALKKENPLKSLAFSLPGGTGQMSGERSSRHGAGVTLHSSMLA